MQFFYTIKLTKIILTIFYQMVSVFNNVGNLGLAQVPPFQSVINTT